MKKWIYLALAVLLLGVFSALTLTACEGKVEDSTGSSYVGDNDGMHTVVFYYNYAGADEIAVEVEDGKTVDRPAEDPIRDRFRFLGWFTGSRGTTPFDFSAPITEDTNVYAKWEQDAVATVIFNYNYPDGTASEPLTEDVNLGSTVNIPDEPSFYRYGFIGWYTDAAGINEFDFNRNITRGITLYAKWEQNIVLISYDLMYDDIVLDGVEVELNSGDPISLLTEDSPELSRPDYEFYGWYTDNEYRNPFDAEAEIKEDITLYAKWNLQVAKVIFDLNSKGADEIPEVRVNVGETVSEPEGGVTRYGYNFTGKWYKDPACTEEFLLTETIGGETEFITVYAGWQAKQVTVILNLNDGSEAVEITGTFDQIIDLANYKDRGEDYTFLGWYTDSDFTDQFADTDPVSSETLVLYAKWLSSDDPAGKVAVRFFYLDREGNPVEIEALSTQVDLGSTITEPSGDKAIRELAANDVIGNFMFEDKYGIIEEYLYVAWYIDEELNVPYNFGNLVSEPLILFARTFAKYVFEAENVDFAGKRGYGAFSYNTDGTGMIYNGDEKHVGYVNGEENNTSNNYYVGDMYFPGTYLDFVIVSEQDTDDAMLELRLSVEAEDMIFGKNKTATMNGYDYNLSIIVGFYDDDGEFVEDYVVDYDDIILSGAVGRNYIGVDGLTYDGQNFKREFENFLVATDLFLYEGENVIRIMVTNNNYHDNTFDADAPLIDCIYIYTDAEIGWSSKDYHYSNTIGK
ncbi:MAG: InlB B-repeat-containing protein [Clostridia bacterium]|nr:InlB B-repeat-containing protein [Clostridia bacterium]